MFAIRQYNRDPFDRAIAVWQKMLAVFVAIWQYGFMTLADYLKSEAIPPSRFASQIEVPASTVLRLLKGQRDPGLDLMRKIAAATDGRVTPNDFAGMETMRHQSTEVGE